jgi:hypothetical protein
MITVLVCYERISLFHTLEPFFLKNRSYRKMQHGKKLFCFTQSARWCLKHDKNQILFMERCFQHREPRDLTDEEQELMKKLRNKYKKIVFFCGQPEAGTNRLDLLPYVDKLYYKSVFSDRENYRKNLYGKNLFADYFHTKYGVSDTPEYINVNTVSAKQSKVPALSWNIGVGNYPRYHWPQRAGTALARMGMPGLGRHVGKFPPGAKHEASSPGIPGGQRHIAVHARIDPVTCPSIAFQRTLFLNLIHGFKRDDLFLTGMVSQKQYYSELKFSKIALSPFGWGEVCFRDFEAILAGALLFKPDMSHLITWPDVYIPYETYVPLKWDGSDLLERSEHYINDEKERKRITGNAYEQYRQQLADLPRRFDSLLEDFFT